MRSRIKIVIVGDAITGSSGLDVKNEIARNFVYKESGGTRIVNVFDNYESTIQLAEQTYPIIISSVSGQEDYDRLRPRSYEDANIFMLVCSLNSVPSFSALKDKWLPELAHFSRGTPIFLVGLSGENPSNTLIQRKQIEELMSDRHLAGCDTGHSQEFHDVVRFFNHAVLAAIKHPATVNTSEKLLSLFDKFTGRISSFFTLPTEEKPEISEPTFISHSSMNPSDMTAPPFRSTSSHLHSATSLASSTPPEAISRFETFPTPLRPHLAAPASSASSVTARKPVISSLSFESIPDEEIPAEFKCPISLGPMQHPVMASDGHTYDQTSLTKWLRTKRTSPLTNLPLALMGEDYFVTNRTLLDTMNRFVEEYRKKLLLSAKPSEEKSVTSEKEINIAAEKSSAEKTRPASSSSITSNLLALFPPAPIEEPSAEMKENKSEQLRPA